MQTLKEIRESVELTQEEVAEKAGHSQSWVSRLEKRGDPRMSQLADYAEGLGAHFIVKIELPSGEAVSAHL